MAATGACTTTAPPPSSGAGPAAGQTTGDATATATAAPNARSEAGSANMSACEAVSAAAALLEVTGSSGTPCSQTDWEGVAVGPPGGVLDLLPGAAPWPPAAGGLIMQQVLPRLVELIGGVATQQVLDMAAGAAEANDSCALMPRYQGHCKMDYASVKVSRCWGD
jgi:hypothetical protein